MTNDPRLDFSFSGLKTALLYAVRELGDDEAQRRRADLAASFQAAVVDQLVAKLRRATRARRVAGASRSAAGWPRTPCCGHGWPSSARPRGWS